MKAGLPRSWLFWPIFLLAGLYALLVYFIPYQGNVPGLAQDEITVAIVFYDDDPDVREARIKVGVQSVAMLPAGYVIMVGGWRPELNNYNGAALMAARALDLGLPPLRVAHDAGSNDTLSNLRGAANLAQRLPDAKIYLVSDVYHLRRIAYLAAQAGMKVSGLIPAEPPFSLLQRMQRINHEIAAWASLLLPRSWVEGILNWSRRADRYRSVESHGHG